MKLSELSPGAAATISDVGAERTLRRHLLDLGLVPGSEVRMLGAAPMGDPVEVQIHGYSLSLRKAEADKIDVNESAAPPDTERQSVEDDNFSYNLALHEHNAHPGLGEGGRYHNHENDEGALPKGEPLSFALVGQPNSGKTALFNRLTGANEHVGNFPGVTMEKTSGMLSGQSFQNITVVDLPGIYSLAPYASQEHITLNFLQQSRPQCIINVVDVSNLERNLYLTVQLMQLGIPMVLAINMIDELRGNGGHILLNEMERILGIPVVAVSAIGNEGVDELVTHAEHVARYHEAPSCRYYSDPTEDSMKGLSAEQKDAVLADARFAFVEKLCRRTVKRPRETKQYLLSRRIDRILTGKWTAIPIFLLVMVGIIVLSIDVIGAPLQNLLAGGIAALGRICERLLISADAGPVLQSLVVDGIFGGVGAVVSFVPILLSLFFFLSMLEDSGYMARVAYVSDKLLRRIGLSGRSIVPLLIGFGCSVPAVMATRTLPSTKDRLLTILLIPFMSCSAKITIYAFLTNAFFPGKGGLVLAILYLGAVLVGVLLALVRKLLSRNFQASPFVMELPNYRLPQMRNVAHLLWDKTRDFLQMAFSVILVASIAIWFLQSFDWRFSMVEGGNGSMLAALAGLMEPVFVPLGLGDWRLITALISGFMAKESVVATMGVLGAVSVLDAASAVSMLAFCLLYTPCVAAIASVRRELGLRWALGMIAFQCAVAWIVALAAYNLALLMI